MILNNCGRRCFDGAIIGDDGKELDAAHSLDHMIMEYAKVRNGGDSSTVAVSKYVTPNVEVCGERSESERLPGWGRHALGALRK